MVPFPSQGHSLARKSSKESVETGPRPNEGRNALRGTLYVCIYFIYLFFNSLLSSLKDFKSNRISLIGSSDFHLKTDSSTVHCSWDQRLLLGRFSSTAILRCAIFLNLWSMLLRDFVSLALKLVKAKDSSGAISSRQSLNVDSMKRLVQTYVILRRSIRNFNIPPPGHTPGI